MDVDGQGLQADAFVINADATNRIEVELEKY